MGKRQIVVLSREFDYIYASILHVIAMIYTYNKRLTYLGGIRPQVPLSGNHLSSVLDVSVQKSVILA